MDTSKESVVLNKDIPIPRNIYVIQCMEEEVKDSSKGNKYIERQWQIISPEAIYSAALDKNVIVAGVTFRQSPIMLKQGEADPKAATKNQNYKTRFIEEAQKMGIDCSDFDPDKPPLAAKSLVVNANLVPDMYSLTADLTAEEVAEGKTEGAVLVNPNTGKPVIGYRVKLGQIFGLNTEVSGNNV